MHIIDVVQGTDAWAKARLGHPTASQFGRIMSAKTFKPLEDRIKYRYELVAEAVLGFAGVKRQYVSQAMKDGIEREPYAADVLASKLGVELLRTGIFVSDDGKMRCSPDRLVAGVNEAVEIKCPEPHTHVGYLLDGPGEQYACQVQGQMLIGHFRCVHFFSWHPELPPFYCKTYPDKRIMQPLAVQLATFCTELEMAKQKMARIMAGMSNERAIGVLEAMEDGA